MPAVEVHVRRRDDARGQGHEQGRQHEPPGSAAVGGGDEREPEGDDDDRRDPGAAGGGGPGGQAGGEDGGAHRGDRDAGVPRGPQHPAAHRLSGGGLTRSVVGRGEQEREQVEQDAGPADEDERDEDDAGQDGVDAERAAQAPGDAPDEAVLAGAQEAAGRLGPGRRPGRERWTGGGGRRGRAGRGGVRDLVHARHPAARGRPAP
jgi:hypothetical protein